MSTFSETSTAPKTPENTTREPAPKNSPKAKMMTRAAVRHALPFGLWIGIMLFAELTHVTESSGTEEIKSLNLISDAGLYALRTVTCILVLLLMRPWKYYDALKKKNILPAIFLGLAVFVLWVGFETKFVKEKLPVVAEFYEKWLVKPFGKMREINAEGGVRSAELASADSATRAPQDENSPVDQVAPVETPDSAAAAPLPDGSALRTPNSELQTPTSSPFAPDVCGWPLTLIRLIGSAFVIAIIEEFFWRGYLLRTVRTPDFLDIDIGEFHPTSFFIVAAIFAIEHAEVGAGLAAGLAYGWFYLRTRDIWAVSIAHVTTNLVLGVYVLATKQWYFW